MNANAVAFVHTVDVDIDEPLPRAGKPIFLQYNFEAGARINGRPVAKLKSNATLPNTVFGGVAADIQPSQLQCRALRHTDNTRKYMRVAVVIHGRVDCRLPRREIPPGLESLAILARWYAPASDDHREAPNATLFVT